MRTWLIALGATLLSSAACAAPDCDLRAPDARAAGPGCARAWMDANLRLNDILTVGTHNSYKTRIPEAEFARLRAVAGDEVKGLEYGHPPLTEQLDDGARQLELDVYYDPQGGRYAAPLGPRLLGGFPPEGYAGAMARPGFKVMHMQDVDFRSRCATFVACLGEIRAWSKAHPDHAPILIMMNAKDGPSSVPGGTAALPFDTRAFDALDAEIAQVFAPNEMVTPDQVRGARAALREAVAADGWPTLGAARGKVLFALDEGPAKTDAYRGGRRTLEGRLVFVNADPSAADAAYATLNDPVADAAAIRAAVLAGMVVRTRADADTVEARAGDGRRRDAALASGAQYVSTDYRRPDPAFGPYQARLPGGATVVCNPVRRPERCAGLPVEP